MITQAQTQATIYLAEQRWCTQTNSFRSFHTFNFGGYFNESRKPHGSLRVFNDDTLSGKSDLSLYADEEAAVLLLPLVGTVNYKTGEGVLESVEVGQAHLFKVSKNSEYELSNHYDNELINFLHCRIKTNTPPDPDGPDSHRDRDHRDEVQKTEFDIDTRQNQLIPVVCGEEMNPIFSCFIGKYNGRSEGTFRLANSGNSVFVFVIEGAFEVQNRLLQSRDGLTLRNVAEIEFEALSNDAIILLLEI